MSQRVSNGDGRESELPIDEVESGNDSNHSIQVMNNHTNIKEKHASHDSNLGDFRTPGKNDNKGSKNGNSSNSSNSSGSGGDNNYSADCSGDGGSDDNQSSDDTSGKPKQLTMMLDSSALLAHHHHHKHKSASKQYNDNTSSGSSSSNEEEDIRKNEKSQTTCSSKNLVGNYQRSNQEGIEQTQEQLSMLSTTAKPAPLHNNKSSSSIIHPQIDLSLVNHIPSSSLVVPLHATATAALLQWNQSNHLAEPTLDNNHNTTSATNTPLVPSNFNNSVPQHMMSQPISNPSENSNGLPAAPWLTVEKYMHLMEAVRPFFSIQGVMYPQHLLATAANAAQAGSTNNDVPVPANNDNCTNPSSSEGFTSFFTTTTDESGGDKKVSTKLGSTEEARVDGTTPEDGITDDNASMTVFARAKRKYARSMQRQQNLPQKSQTMESTTTSSSDASSSDRDQNLRHHAPADENNHHNNLDPSKKMLRMVTDVSSSNPTTTSGSGSGDNGMNTTTGGSGSGTGSNQGSSGSGNDGKGSSEELAKEDSNSGGDGMNGSDGSSNSVNKTRANQGASSMPDESNLNASERLHQQNHQNSLSTGVRDGLNVNITTTTGTASREQKMLVKKRKRIVMRREYEAQQRQMSSSESSGDSTEHFFQPGRPLTLDQVLVFSKIPRLIIQGTSPFLVVHMNAASCRLTGIDAHSVVGKPVSAILSIPSFSADDGDIADGVRIDAASSTIPSTTTRTAAVEAFSDNTGVLESDENQMTIDRLVMTHGCDGDMHLVYVRSKSLHPSVDSDEHNKMLCRLAIAPIVVSKDVFDGGATCNRDHSKRTRYQDNQVGSEDMSHVQQQELKFPLITHFVMQFELYDNDQYGDNMESMSSSNSVDEQVIGMSSKKHEDMNDTAHDAQPGEAKTGQPGANNVDGNFDHDQSNVEGTDIDGSISVQSSDREPIVAIG